MRWLDKIPEQSIVIVPSTMKKKVIVEMNQTTQNYKIMTFQEVETYLEFTFTKDALYFLSTTCHLSIPIAKMYMEQMKYLPTQKIKQEKLEKVQIYYEVLKQYNKLQFSSYGKTFFEGRSIYIIGFDFFTKLQKHTIEELKQITNVEILTFDEPQASSIDVYEFSHIQEEVESVALELAKKIEEGVPLNHLYLIGVTEEYEPYIERIFKFYQLPIENAQKPSLYHTRIGKEFLKGVQTKSREEIVSELQQKYHHTKEEIKLVNLCIDLLNRYGWYEGEIKEVYDYIKEEVKETFVPTTKEQSTISYGTLLHTWYDEEDYVFVIGMNQGSIPIIVKDEAYITDDVSELTYKDSSVIENKNQRMGTKQSILRIPHLYMSYKLATDEGVCYPSALLQELPVQIKHITWDYHHNYGHDYNLLTMASLLDQLKNYNQNHPALPILTSNYGTDSYLSYHHEFTKIPDLTVNPILSYTSLNSYMECAFKYYVTYLLKLNQYEESFAQKVGNIYHYVLSYWQEDPDRLKQILQEQLNLVSFTVEEQVWWEPLESHLWMMIDVLKDQQLCTDFKQEEHEKEVVVTLQDQVQVKGFIDKILHFQKDGIHYHALVDYKTGNTDISLKELDYGFGLQLPFYLFLLMHTKENPLDQVVGFYLQKCLQFKLHTKHQESLKEQIKTSLKLEGYTINEESILSHFDKTYENSEWIKGLQTTKSGFSSYAKLVTKNQIEEINQKVENHILRTWEAIHQGDFTINPKVLADKNKSCGYCPFQDLCFKTYNDVVYLGGDENE